MEEQLTTRQVAEALSVSESSVKRWCDRGVIPTVRTVGGHRRIPLPQFLEFLQETDRKLVAPLPTSLKTSSMPTAPLGAGKASAEAQLDLQREFGQSLRDGDLATCRELALRWYAQHGGLAQLADELIASNMELLGHQWEQGEAQVYQERRGCEICSTIIHELNRLIPEVPASSPLALGCTPSGDPYCLASQLAELVLRESHWRAENMGTNVPLSSVTAAVLEKRPRLLWLSVSHIENQSAFVDSYQEMMRTIPEHVVVVIGGRGLTDELRPRLKYTAHCDNMVQLTSFARALHGRRPEITASDN